MQNRSLGMLGIAVLLGMLSVPLEKSSASMCSADWYITGYFVPVETDYTGPMKSIVVDGQTRTFYVSFLDAVNIEGWGKAKEGDYIGYFSGAYHLSSYGQDSQGNPLRIGSVAVDTSIISLGSKLTIPTLPSPWNNKILTASDTGGTIKGKHIDIFTGEGKSAEDETFRITGEDNRVCIVDEAFITSKEGISHTCNCVAFRLDDVQDYFAREAQMDLIKMFLTQNATLTIGVIAGALYEDAELIQFLQNAVSTGRIEVANHSWIHSDHTNMTKEEQTDSIFKANDRIRELFGGEVKTFIPPYDAFNNDTLSAMKEAGLMHLSGSIFERADPPPYPLKNGDSVFHFPATAFVSNPDTSTGRWTILQNEQVLRMIRTSVEQYGFAAVVMHPQAYYDKQNSAYAYNKESMESLHNLLKEVRKEFNLVKISEIDRQGWIPKYVGEDIHLYHYVVPSKQDTIIATSTPDISIEMHEEKLFIQRNGKSWGQPVLLWIPKALVSQEPVVVVDATALPSLEWFDSGSNTWVVYIDPPVYADSIRVIPESGHTSLLLASTFAFLLFIIAIRGVGGFR